MTRQEYLALLRKRLQALLQGCQQLEQDWTQILEEAAPHDKWGIQQGKKEDLWWSDYTAHGGREEAVSSQAIQRALRRIELAEKSYASQHLGATPAEPTAAQRSDALEIICSFTAQDCHSYTASLDMRTIDALRQYWVSQSGDKGYYRVEGVFTAEENKQKPPKQGSYVVAALRNDPQLHYFITEQDVEAWRLERGLSVLSLPEVLHCAFWLDQWCKERTWYTYCPLGGESWFVCIFRHAGGGGMLWNKIYPVTSRRIFPLGPYASLLFRQG